MAFFEGLKKIIPANIAEKLYDYDLKVSHSNSASDKNHHVDKDKKIVTIYLNKLTFKEKNILEKQVLNSFNENKLKFVENDKIDLVEKLIAYDKKDNGTTLTFFSNILTKNDLLALRDSLFLRDEYLSGHIISDLKKDIALAYGERGNIISNLCSAGYFEEVMIPLFNKSKTEFMSFYDVAVDRGVKALFVNAGMTTQTIKEEIKRRLNSAKASGLKSINIHGIGKKNIQNIKSCLIKEKEDDKIKFLDKKIYEKENVIIVEIIL